MKPITFIILLFFSILCYGQNTDFSSYLSKYRVVNVPIIIDRRYSSTLFPKESGPKEIPDVYVKEFLCGEIVKCDIDSTSYRYSFGVRLNMGLNFEIVLFNKQKNEGKPDCDFDLSETIMVVYSNNGEILSMIVLGKDNDC